MSLVSNGVHISQVVTTEVKNAAASPYQTAKSKPKVSRRDSSSLKARADKEVAQSNVQGARKFIKHDSR